MSRRSHQTLDVRGAAPELPPLPPPSAQPTGVFRQPRQPPADDDIFNLDSVSRYVVNPVELTDTASSRLTDADSLCQVSDFDLAAKQRRSLSPRSREAMKKSTHSWNSPRGRSSNTLLRGSTPSVTRIIQRVRLFADTVRNPRNRDHRQRRVSPTPSTSIMASMPTSSSALGVAASVAVAAVLEEPVVNMPMVLPAPMTMAAPRDYLHLADITIDGQIPSQNTLIARVGPLDDTRSAEACPTATARQLRLRKNSYVETPPAPTPPSTLPEHGGEATAKMLIDASMQTRTSRVSRGTQKVHHHKLVDTQIQYDPFWLGTNHVGSQYDGPPILPATQTIRKACSTQTNATDSYNLGVDAQQPQDGKMSKNTILTLLRETYQTAEVGVTAHRRPKVVSTASQPLADQHITKSTQSTNTQPPTDKLDPAAKRSTTSSLRSGSSRFKLSRALEMYEQFVARDPRCNNDRNSNGGNRKWLKNVLGLRGTRGVAVDGKLQNRSPPEEGIERVGDKQSPVSVSTEAQRPSKTMTKSRIPVRCEGSAGGGAAVGSPVFPLKRSKSRRHLRL